MRIVIAGAGEVGTHLAKMLSFENHDITLVDSDEERLKEIGSRLDLITYTGSANSIRTLKMAGVSRADLLISVTYSEAVNLTTCILGKKMGARKCIARIDNLEYLNPENQEYLNDLGIDNMIYPEQIAAQELVNTVHSAASSEIVSFADGKINLFGIKLDETSRVLNQTIEQLSAMSEELHFRIVGITRNGKTHIPLSNDRLQLNDTLYLITDTSGIDAFFELAGKHNYDIRNIMILGGSRVGKNTAKELGREFNVKLIERDRQKSFELSNYLNNTLVINGDGTRFELLMEEGLSKMDAFIAVTGNSETNMLSCLLAKRMGVKKTIAEIENIDYIELGENMGIDTIINKKLITASKIFGYTISEDVANIKCLTGTDAEVIEFVAKPDSRITKAPLNELDFPKDAVIGGLIRGRLGFIATGKTEIQAFDRVVVFALPEAISKLSKYFS